METERELLDAIHSGDRQALRRLYDRYSGYALAIGHRYIPDSEDVKDVLQESFVRIFTSRGEFDYHGEGSLKSWVGRIVINRSIDWVRVNERMHFSDNLPEEVAEDPPDVDDVPPEVLNRMIGRLPAGYRLVLNLHVFDHLSHTEIARRLGIQENSSASQYSRAKRLLTEMIQEYLKSQRI